MAGTAKSSAAPRLSQRAGWAGGQPISRLMHLALAHPNLISLAAGFVDQETLPVEPAREAIEAVLADAAGARAALQYGTTAGYPPLREAVLARLIDADDHPATEAKLSIDQVVVTAGSNQLLHLLNEALLDAGDIVLCAAPSYFVYLGMVGNGGARTVGVAADEQGMIPDALEEELHRRERFGELNRVKAIYVTSYYDNPASATLSAERRAAIVETAKRWSRATKIYVIEDAAYRALRYEGDDLASMRSYDAEGDTVVVAETFSKSFSPGIRVGWGVLPPDLVGPILSLKGNIDFGSPNFTQHVMAEVLARGLFDRQVALLQESYLGKLAATLEAADEFLAPLDGVRWQRPTGGLYVWLRLPESIDTGPGGRLMQLAMDEGMLYVPGEYCYPAEGAPPRKNMIRLSFGVQSPANIRRGVEALAKAIRQVS